MGCCTSHVTDGAQQPVRACSCVTAGCLRSTSGDDGSQSYPSKIKSKTPENGENSPGYSRGSKSKKASRQTTPWENALAPVAAAFTAAESALPPIWWYSERAVLPGLPGVASGAESGSEEELSSRTNTWSSAFAALHSRPVEEVADRLLELGVRPWQSIWRHLSRELHLALRRLGNEEATHGDTPVTPTEEDGWGIEGAAADERDSKEPVADPLRLLDATLWDDACRILTLAAAGDIPFDDLYARGPGESKMPSDMEDQRLDTAMPKAYAAFRAAVKVRRRLLRLQEQLVWLARVVATALADEDLHEPLIRAVKRDFAAVKEGGFTSGTRLGSHSRSDLTAWLETGGTSGSSATSESESEKLRQLAHAGFELQGVFFRLVSDAGDWRIACAEIQRTRMQGGAEKATLPSPRLIVALEGLGLRLLAVPALPKIAEKDADRIGVGLECLELGYAYLEQMRVAPPEDREALVQWADGLPNPRGLLSLTEPLVLAASTSATVGLEEAAADEYESKAARFLALCFGASGDASSANASEDLSAAACGSPAVVSAGTEKALMQRVASALQCSLSDLKRYEHPKAEASERQWCNVFGCVCEVWYRPAKSDSKRNSSVWSWRSNSFALLFQGPVLPQSPRSAQATCGNSEDSTSRSLSSRLATARSFLRTNLGFPRHPRAVRCTLHAYGIPARFAAALAEPRLHGRCRDETQISAEPSALLLDEVMDEVVGADLLAAAAKHVMRVLTVEEGTTAPSNLPSSGTGAAEASGRLLSALRHELTKASRKGRENAEAASQQLAGGASQPGSPQRQHSGGGNTSDPLGAIETESPIPPLPPKSLLAGEGQDSGGGNQNSVGAISSADGRCQCSSTLESEVQHLLTAFEVHPELDRSVHTLANQKTLATCRLGLLYVAFWVRLVSSARQLQVLQELRFPGLNGSYAGNHQDNGGTATTPLALILPEVGKRLLSAAWRAPPTLARSLASQLHVELMPSVLRRLRPCSESVLAPLSMRLPEAYATKLPGVCVVQVAHCRAKTAMSLKATVADALSSSADAAAAGVVVAEAGNGVAPSKRGSELAFVAGSFLVGHDLELHPDCLRSRRLAVSRTPREYGGVSPEVENGSGYDSAESSVSAVSLSARAVDSATSTAEDLVAEVNASLRVHPSSEGGLSRSSVREGGSRPGIAASLAAAICISRQVQDHRFPHHQGQRARDLLQCAQWLLLSIMQEVYLKNSAQPMTLPAVDFNDFTIPLTSAGTASGGPAGDGACIARVLTAVMYLLQLAAMLITNMGSCPPELLVALWTLRGYVWEKRGQIEASFVDYLQALSMIDEEWGDPRKRGGRGHPFALLLSWKLGLISYCRGDGKSIDKFADYFRSLVLQYAAVCPFTWGPPASLPNSHVQKQAALDEEEISKFLWANEACLWNDRGLWTWWMVHDPLNYGREFSSLPISRMPMFNTETMIGWQRSNLLRQRDMVNPEGSIASDLQEVRRGTIFAFGSNQFGQLGVGPPTMVSALSDKQQLSNGFAPTNGFASKTQHSGSDLWWSGRPARVMALKECRLRDIACGESHCAAVDLEGQVFAWGMNEYRQVGACRHAADIAHGKTSDTGDCPVIHLPVCVNPINPPTELAPTLRVKFATVACGAQFSLALDKAGTIWAWGGGDGGVLGLSVSGLAGRSAPTMVEALHSANCTAVACGSYHAMALARDGELHAWGRAEGGQLGLAELRIEAHIEEKSLEDTCVCEPLRVFFTGLSRGDPAAVGGDAVASESAAAAVAAAAKESPRSDLRATADHQSEDPVRVKQVACGDVHSCALDVAGQVWSWGWGEFGQLGLGFSSASYEAGLGGRSSKRPTPEAVEPRHFEFMRIKSVACGGAFSAAVGDITPGHVPASYSGNLFLWGANEVGQCTLPPKKLSEVDVPTKAQGLANIVVRSIACGASHVVALDTNGRAYSWGAAHYGQLGASMPLKTFSPPPACEPREAGSAIAHQHQPTLIQSVSRLHIMKAACGLHHTLLVSEVSSDGSAARAAARSAGDGVLSGRSASAAGSAGGSSSGAGGLVASDGNGDTASEGAASGSGASRPSGFSANRGGANGTSGPAAAA